MKHMTRQETTIKQLLQRARTIAVVGASPRPERHSHSVVSYLHRAGYDVIPVRPDLQRVDGLKSYAQLADIPVRVDLAVVFRRSDAAPQFVSGAASKGVEAVWLPPGVWTKEAEEQASEYNVLLIKDRCIEEDHRHVWKDSGHPERLGVNVGRRRPADEQDRKKQAGQGYAAGGGGGRKGDGGKRSVLNEKKCSAKGLLKLGSRSSAVDSGRRALFSRTATLERQKGEGILNGWNFSIESTAANIQAQPCLDIQSSTGLG